MGLADPPNRNTRFGPGGAHIKRNSNTGWKNDLEGDLAQSHPSTLSKENEQTRAWPNKAFPKGDVCTLPLGLGRTFKVAGGGVLLPFWGGGRKEGHVTRSISQCAMLPKMSPRKRRRQTAGLAVRVLNTRYTGVRGR